MWARLGVKHPGTGPGEPSIGVRDILMLSMLINLLLLLLLPLLLPKVLLSSEYTGISSAWVHTHKHWPTHAHYITQP
jgi:hypothetical protein